MLNFVAAECSSTQDNVGGTVSRGSPFYSKQNAQTAQMVDPSPARSTYYAQAGTGNPKPKHFTWLTASLSLFSTHQQTLRCLKMHSTSWQGKEIPTINPPSYARTQGYGSDLQPSSSQPNTSQNRALPLRAAVIKAVDVCSKEHHRRL